MVCILRIYNCKGLSITRVEPVTTSHNQVSASDYEESTSDSLCEIKITGTHSIGKYLLLFMPKYKLRSGRQYVQGSKVSQNS